MLTIQVTKSSTKIMPLIPSNSTSDTEKPLSFGKLEKQHLSEDLNDLGKLLESEDSMTLNPLSFSSIGLDPETMKLLSPIIDDAVDIEFEFQESEPIFLFDYSLPAEINTESHSTRFGEIKLEKLRKTRLPLKLSIAGLSVSIIAALLTLPYPYNWASAIALGGPLFVSSYGLLTQKS